MTFLAVSVEIAVVIEAPELQPARTVGAELLGLVVANVISLAEVLPQIVRSPAVRGVVVVKGGLGTEVLPACALVVDTIKKKAVCGVEQVICRQVVATRCGVCDLRGPSGLVREVVRAQRRRGEVVLVEAAPLVVVLVESRDGAIRVDVGVVRVVAEPVVVYDVVGVVGYVASALITVPPLALVARPIVGVNVRVSTVFVFPLLSLVFVQPLAM